MSWGTEVEIERRNRIILSIAAYSYEFESESLISDADYDELSRRIRPEIETGNKKLDAFFSKTFYITYRYVDTQTPRV
jgi:NAD-dependent DNA ligase